MNSAPNYRLAQEREFHKYIPPDDSQSYYIPSDPGSQSTFDPQASQDAALTSFAQLGAIRLRTERALISLFDRTHQHVVAEATPTLDLVGGRCQDEKDRLRLGCCVLPKEKGICHHVEGLKSRGTAEHDELRSEDAFVVMDTSKHERFSGSNLIEAISDTHFYAAVPIVSPRGFTIGAYSVLDSKPRTTPPSQNEVEFMKNMAATVMKHLEMEHSALRNAQAERKMVGLGSFIEGRSTLRDSWKEADAQYAASQESGQPREGQLNIQQQDLQQFGNGQSKKDLPVRERPAKSTNGPTPRIETENKTVRTVAAGETLQDHTLSDGIKQTFSRAANLIRESIGAEGVLFLSADSVRFGNLVPRNTRRVSGPAAKHPKHSDDDESTDSSGASWDSNTEAESENTPVSECLGFSSSTQSSIDAEADAGQAIVVPEPLFSSLIRRYPRGKIFSYNNNGSVSEDSDSLSTTPAGQVRRSREKRASSRRRRKPTFEQDAHSLISIFAGARNILLLPIWDSDKSRWFAGTLVWTNDPGHVFTFEDEVTYISAFANSIMAEIRRLDVEIAEKAKTNLVSSITHELRNPLHGILGTSEILSDTAMNALQHGMVHTIESCGRTLLDTINHLLDLTVIDKYQRQSPQSGKNKVRKKRPTPGIPKGPDALQSKERGENLSFTHVQLDSVLEEVTECVFAGYSFYTHPSAPPPAMTSSSSRWGGPTSKSDPVGPRASQVTIIFDIQPDTEWHFYTHAGAWRRILMNIFGNALKYTKSGFIYLGLSSKQIDPDPLSKDSQHKEEPEFEVTLTVKDTGKGIGPKYLQEGLFTAFSQEDPLASGSGLGLSIVRQAVGFLGGSIEIESTQNVGTTLSIRTPLALLSDTSDNSSSSAVFRSMQKYTQDKSIGFLGFGSDLQSSRDKSLYSSLERLCHDWFGLEVARTSVRGDEEKFDFYLAVQTELNSEDTQGRDLFGRSQRLVDRNGRLAPVVVICQSPEEAHSMFVAAKSRSEMLYFEFISQPCGPRKLARALDICVKRQAEQSPSDIKPDETTHWVEMPGSSRLPLDVGPSEPPSNRMKISKRPTTDTMGDESEKESAAKSPEEAPETAVLLVDDNDLNLQLLCAYTEKDNHPYMTAQNGAEAVEAYKADPGKYQFVIIDISMPVMDGFEASRQIRRIEQEHRAKMSESEQKASPRTVIAALTGLDSPSTQKEAFSSGIDTFLIKPVKRPELQAILRG
ncbi:hypothetical protein ASPVEDRAFT_192342, partial [Aspergillus versicolor CBS 583.65]